MFFKVEPARATLGHSATFLAHRVRQGREPLHPSFATVRLTPSLLAQLDPTSARTSKDQATQQAVERSLYHVPHAKFR